MVAVTPAEPAAVPVRVLRQFLLPGHPDPEPGDTLQLPRPMALELAMYRKVELIDPADTFTPADPTPEPAPAPAGKASKTGAPAS